MEECGDASSFDALVGGVLDEGRAGNDAEDIEWCVESSVRRTRIFIHQW